MSAEAGGTDTMSNDTNLTNADPGISDWEYYTSMFFDFFVPGVMLNLIAGLGLVGNVISAIILSRPQVSVDVFSVCPGVDIYALRRALW